MENVNIGWIDVCPMNESKDTWDRNSQSVDDVCTQILNHLNRSKASCAKALQIPKESGICSSLLVGFKMH